MASVTELGPDDAEAAVALWEEAELTRPWNDPHADFARAVAGPASAVLGLVDGGALIGTAMVGHDGHRGAVYYLALASGRRGEGLGRELMAACEDWLRERGVPKLNIMIRADNSAVQGFYAALGYQTEDRLVLSSRLDAG